MPTDPVQAGLFIAAVAAVFTALGAIVQARATRWAAKWSVDAQRAIAYDAALRAERQANIGNFVSRAEATIALYRNAMALASTTAIPNQQAYIATLEQLEKVHLIAPMGVSDSRVQTAVQTFQKLELGHRDLVLQTIRFNGADVRQREADALTNAIPDLEQAFGELEAAVNSYVWGARPDDADRYRWWLPWRR